VTKLAILALAVAACSKTDVASSAPAFRLQCRPSGTATAAQVHCIRTDTRSGDIVHVEMFKLPVSQGPTGVPAGAPGRFEVECAAASTDTKSDFYCVRLNTETGEMMLVNLQKIPPFPADVR
jgi:hypothetical protein